MQDADPHPRALGEEPLGGTANYFIGNDPSQWRTGIPTYARVQYQDVYPGVDLVYYGTPQGQLEDDFVVAPGADAGAVMLGFAGANGLELDATGALVVHTGVGEVRLQPPNVYQDTNGLRQSISAAYVLGDDHVGFNLGVYDPTRPLIIDPALVYSTYLGGSSGDAGSGIALDAAGNAYVTGWTYSDDFPTTPGALQSSFSAGGTAGGPEDAFVSKLNSTGTALIYSTYLGGDSGIVSGFMRFSIAVDAGGNAYVAGAAQSPGFPTTPGAFQRTSAGGQHAFASKLNPTGTALLYSTYLGGSSNDEGFDVAVDAAGEAYVTGVTSSRDFPTTPGAFQATLPLGSIGTAFVSKLNSSGSALVYSTYLGDTNDQGLGLALDAAGAAYVTGTTLSVHFPTTPAAFQPAPGGGNCFGNVCSDAFVSKLNSTGTALIYSTYLGGSGDDFGSRIAIDVAGNAYVTGGSMSADFPSTPGSFQSSFGNGPDGIVAKLNATGTTLVYSTFLDGGVGLGIAVNEAGNAYVTGETGSATFPTTKGAFQTTLRGAVNAFVEKISPGPPACEVTGLLAGPPTQLHVAIHADRGLSTVLVTQATNATVAISPFTQGSIDSQAMATKLDQRTRSTFTLRVTDQTGASTDCDPALVTVGRAPGDTPVQVVHHVARAESHVTITNGTPGVESLRLLVNGQTFEVTGLQNGQKRTLDLSAAMRKGTDNTILVIAHGPRDSSALVLVSDS